HPLIFESSTAAHPLIESSLSLRPSPSSLSLRPSRLHPLQLDLHSLQLTLAKSYLLGLHHRVTSHLSSSSLIHHHPL
ncbi:hypothetical protein Dimus_010857, partial [Dionaea muscipula]